MAFLIGGANSAADTGYDIDNSLRLADDAYLDRTRSSQSNTTGTFSAWIKTAAQNNIRLAGGHTDVNNRSYFYFPTSGGSGGLFSRTSGSLDLDFNTNALYRDPSAWYHLVIAFDTTQATESNRVKWYVNGEQVTSFSASTYPSQDASIPILNQAAQTIGAAYGASAVSEWSDGYIAEVYYVDGTAYAASDFGETDEDSGIWKPKKASVTYGTNGFKLEFKETGTNQDSSGIGADTSGNDNHLAVTSLAATDQTTDTPTNNFCTLNPIDKIAGASIAFSEGNLKAAVDDNGNTRGNFFVNSGKWYWETLIVSGDSVSTVGIAEPGYYSGNLFDGSSTAKGYIYINDGNKRSPAGSAGAYGDSYADDDIIGVALNMDDGEVKFYKNNTVQNSGTAAFTSLSGDHGIYYQGYGGTATVILNTGHDSSFAGNKTAQNNADENGYGDFYYSPPNGFYALCTKNLAEYG